VNDFNFCPARSNQVNATRTSAILWLCHLISAVLINFCANEGSWRNSSCTPPGLWNVRAPNIDCLTNCMHGRDRQTRTHVCCACACVSIIIKFAAAFVIVIGGDTLLVLLGLQERARASIINFARRTPPHTHINWFLIRGRGVKNERRELLSSNMLIPPPTKLLFLYISAGHHH